MFVVVENGPSKVVHVCSTMLVAIHVASITEGICDAFPGFAEFVDYMCILLEIVQVRKTISISLCFYIVPVIKM